MIGRERVAPWFRRFDATLAPALYKKINTRQRIALWSGTMLGLLMGAYPPWVVSLSTPTVQHSKRAAGYHFILSPPPRDDIRYAARIFGILDTLKSEIELDPTTFKKVLLDYRIDNKRLFVHWFILLIGIAGLMWALASRQTAEEQPKVQVLSPTIITEGEVQSETARRLQALQKMRESDSFKDLPGFEQNDIVRQIINLRHELEKQWKPPSPSS